MKRYIAAILIPCLLLQFTGCYTSNYITKEQFLDDSKVDIEITTYNDEEYSLGKGRYSVKNDTIFIIANKPFVDPYKVSFIPLYDVKKYEVKELNSTDTILLIGAVVLAIGLIVLAIGVIEFNNSFPYK